MRPGAYHRTHQTHAITTASPAASVLTFARPKAPHVAGRALSASAGEQVNRPTHIEMRPLRQKSSRFLSRGALEERQSQGLFALLTGTCPPIKRRTEGLRIRTCCRRHATSISSVTVAPGRIPMPGVRVGSPLQLFPPPEIAEFPLRFQSACVRHFVRGASRDTRVEPPVEA